MKNKIYALSLALAVFSTGSHAAFKEFSLSGHSATTYNERGYTLGIDMDKRMGEKIFTANVILPTGAEFHNDEITSTFSFDSQPVSSLGDEVGKRKIGKSDEAVSWEIDRFSDSVRSVPTDSDLYEFMRRYHFKFNYVDADGRARSAQMGLRNSSSTISELIKR